MINTTLADVIISFAYIPLTFFTVKMVNKYNEFEKKLPDLQDGPREIKIDSSEILDSI